MVLEKRFDLAAWCEGANRHSVKKRNQQPVGPCRPRKPTKQRKPGFDSPLKHATLKKRTQTEETKRRREAKRQNETTSVFIGGICKNMVKALHEKNFTISDHTPAEVVAVLDKVKQYRENPTSNQHLCEVGVNLHDKQSKLIVNIYYLFIQAIEAVSPLTNVLENKLSILHAISARALVAYRLLVLKIMKESIVQSRRTDHDMLTLYSDTASGSNSNLQTFFSRLMNAMASPTAFKHQSVQSSSTEEAAASTSLEPTRTGSIEKKPLSKKAERSRIIEVRMDQISRLSSVNSITS
jgi:hypothetical protein